MLAEIMTIRRTLSGYFDATKNDAAAERVADDVRLLELEVVDQCADVVGHQPDVDGSVDVGRPTMALQVDCDDLVVVGELRKDRREHVA